MIEPISSDERLSWALRLLAAARRSQDASQMHHAETLVISLLLPRAIALVDEVTGRGPFADVERVTAARLTRAVLAWDPAVLAPDRAAAALIHETVRANGSGGPTGAEPLRETATDACAPRQDPTVLPRPRWSVSVPAIGTGSGLN